jgi:hypothetical protein
VGHVALLDLQAEVHAIVGGEDDVTHSSPGLWVPHVTLASRLDAEAVGRALAAVEAFEDEEVREAPEDARGPVVTPASSLVSGRRWDPSVRTVVVLGR